MGTDSSKLDSSVSVLQWPPHSPRLNPVKAVMSSRSRISKECYQSCVKSMSQRMQMVLSKKLNSIRKVYKLKN